MINKVITCRHAIMKYIIIFTATLGTLIATMPVTANNSEQSAMAEEKVKTFDCKGKPVQEVLKGKIKRHSQRDLGWRVFYQDEYIDVERAILVNKGRKSRYRWRIDQQGNIFPVSKKAKKLCL